MQARPPATPGPDGAGGNGPGPREAPVRRNGRWAAGAARPGSPPAPPVEIFVEVKIHKWSSLGKSTEPAASPAAPNREAARTGAGRGWGVTGAEHGNDPVTAPWRGTCTPISPVAEPAPLRSSVSAGVCPPHLQGRIWGANPSGLCAEPPLQSLIFVTGSENPGVLGERGAGGSVPGYVGA